MLQPVGTGSAPVFSNGPAIFAVQPRDHPGHQLGGMPHGLVRANGDAIRSMSAENSVCHRLGSTLTTVATAAYSDVFTNSEQAAVTALTRADTPDHTGHELPLQY